jgi:beta-xylosidase
MIDSVMIWNEPNNKSHWDFEIDNDWQLFADMAKLASDAITAENPRITKVLGGISPIDPNFIANMRDKGVLDHVDVVAVHGFPLDWNLWQLNDWPQKLEEVATVTKLPIWVSEVGVSTFGADEVQVFGLERTAQLLAGKSERVHWYSLFDLPSSWEATTRHREAEGSSYYRHFYMGLIREDGTTKPALDVFSAYAPELGICQWFHYEDHRLEDAVRWLRKLGVKYLRTGLSWSDAHRENCLTWFDKQMAALDEFNVTLTFCFTPESEGMVPHYTSPPREPERFADFCAQMVQRYA